jgi:hypothetical protein
MTAIWLYGEALRRPGRRENDVAVANFYRDDVEAVDADWFAESEVQGDPSRWAVTNGWRRVREGIDVVAHLRSDLERRLWRRFKMARAA